MPYEPDGLKIAVVRAFIKKAFPGSDHEVIDRYDADRGAEMFNIRQHGNLIHRFGVSRELLDDHSVTYIEMLLDEQTVEYIKRRGPERVSMLTNDGPQDRK